MYPFKAILVSGDGAVLDELRQQLGAQLVVVEETFPDVAAATSWLDTAADDKRLFLLHLGSGPDLEPVKRLRSWCVGRPILVLLHDADTDKAALIRVMRAGADQVVLLPLASEDLQAALDSLAWQFGYAGRSRVIAVAGVAAGAGATTLAVNLAYELAHGGREAILVEMNTCMGKLADVFAVQPRFTVRDLAEAGDRIDAHMVEQALAPVAEHLRLLAAPTDQVQAVAELPTRFKQYFAHLRRLAEVSVLDMPPTFSAAYYKALAAADQVLVCARHTPASLRDLKLMCETLRKDHGVGTVFPVVNHYTKGRGDLALDQMHAFLAPLRVLTVAADTGGLANGSLSHRPLHLQAPRSAALADIAAIARVLFNDPEPRRPASRRFGLLGWLGRVFSDSGTGA